MDERSPDRRRDDPMVTAADPAHGDPVRRDPLPPEAPPTSDQLRADIDSGRTHDKVAHSDPAAAPLGSDAEAAGAPPTPDEVSTARRHETSRAVPEQGSASRIGTPTGGRSGSRIIWLVVAAIVAAIVLAFVF